MAMPAAGDGTEERLAFLGDPASYPDRPTSVQRLDTHMAWVFLAGAHAWKLKRPVRYPFLDFSTIELRRRDCEAELRLNRRLAPDVYLGVVPLIRRTDGRLRLGGDGEPVDWLVQMRRLDAMLFLDRLIARGSVPEAALRSAARLLAGFYRSAPPSLLTPEESLDDLRRRTRDTLASLAAAVPDLPADDVALLARRLEQALASLAPLLLERAAGGRIVEGHGDLRPEHVWLGEPPAIIDCLEFDEALRLLDPLDELAFLGLETDLLGGTTVGPAFLAVYREITGDPAPATLLAFYRARRATLRAKLMAWHISEPGRHGPGHWRTRSRVYLHAALAALG
ncbi:hypothetical protein SH611_17805 [Geminicoccaceae bacterium 1502E]|nr:hypothetical protein [Geminicoccaceae bacterium 1502E]